MDARTTLVQRPMGPRSINRSSTPTSYLASPDSSSPGRKLKPTLSPPTPSQSESSRPALPSLTLSIPRAPVSKPSVPKIKINLGSTGGPLFESYAGGPNGPPLEVNPVPDDVTIIPEPITVMPPHKLAESFGSLRELVTELEVIRATLPPSANSQSPPSYSDDVLEEIGRIGEGAGGAVHKVKDKRTGLIMARKTITTREVPMKQLMRELSIAASAEHINIIKWHGAYMSPSSNEIKILMEYGEGGSLEGVGKRIKERGAVVGEKIAGRLAEGVSTLTDVLTPRLSLSGIDPSGACLPPYQKDDSQRYQALQHSLITRRNCQVVRLWRFWRARKFNRWYIHRNKFLYGCE